MPRAKIARDDSGRFYGIRILCPGCLYSNETCMSHVLPINTLPEGETEFSPHISWKDRWTFNGDFEKPVFSPSLNTRWGGETRTYTDDDGNNKEYSIPLHRCHSFIGCNGAQPGQIVFLNDCTHELAGKIVDLPDIPEDRNY